LLPRTNATVQEIAVAQETPIAQEIVALILKPWTSSTGPPSPTPMKKNLKNAKTSKPLNLLQCLHVQALLVLKSLATNF
jgi:hypothetical protein